MADDRDPEKKKPGEKPPGKFHYNPVGMSGKKAGIVEEVEKEQEREQDGREDRKPPSDPSKVDPARRGQ